MTTPHLVKRLLVDLRNRIVDRLRRFLRIPPNYIGDHGCLRAAAGFAAWNMIEGDYLEFGVFQGWSFRFAYKEILAQRTLALSGGSSAPGFEAWKAARPRFFAFDGFSGLPGGQVEREIDYHEGAWACTAEDFVRNIVDGGVHMDDVVVVKGYFSETCNSETKAAHRLEKAAIVMIDCDLYESTVPVMSFLTDLVQQGTVLIFQDWFRFKGRPGSGEQRACNEWLRRNPHIELVELWREGWQAIAFLVNLQEPAA